MKALLVKSPVCFVALLFYWGTDAAVAQSKVAQSIEITFKADRTGKDLERELILYLRNKSDRTPVLGANVEIDVDMTSMPMMHKVPKAVAKPGDVAGEYRARVKLEMAGEWAAHITVKSPFRLKTVRKFDVSENGGKEPKHSAH